MKKTILLLSVSLLLTATLCLLAMLFIVRWMDTLPWPLWLTSLVIFVLAWIGQFIGHNIEGSRPSFFKDVQFLLIGPIFDLTLSRAQLYSGTKHLRRRTWSMDRGARVSRSCPRGQGPSPR